MGSEKLLTFAEVQINPGYYERSGYPGALFISSALGYVTLLRDEILLEVPRKTCVHLNTKAWDTPEPVFYPSTKKVTVTDGD